jgi:DUF4097 and DUF4098 domain-containing protein YvlB
MKTQIKRILPEITITYVKCMAVFAAACMALLSANAATSSISQSFDVNSGGKLVVHAESTKIDVRGGESSQLNVHITRGDDSEEDIRDDYDIALTQNGNTVDVSIKRRSKIRIGFSRSLALEVSLPGKFDVDLNSSGGRISVKDVSGEIQSRTSGGSLSFDNVAGTVQGKTSGGSIQLSGNPETADLTTSGGSIRVGTVEGDVNANTSGGSISIDSAGGSVIAKTSGGSIKIGEAHGKIKAKTSGGKIVAHLPTQLSADSELSTSGGSVTVYLGDSFSANVNARTSGGRVHNDFPILTQGSSSKSSLKGELNGGGPELHLRASGGSINLRKI